MAYIRPGLQARMHTVGDAAVVCSLRDSDIDLDDFDDSDSWDGFLDSDMFGDFDFDGCDSFGYSDYSDYDGFDSANSGYNERLDNY